MNNARQKHKSASRLWVVDYYLVEFYLLLGQKEKAIQRLNDSIQGGNIKAQYRLEALDEG